LLIKARASSCGWDYTRNADLTLYDRLDCPNNAEPGRWIGDMARASGSVSRSRGRAHPIAEPSAQDTQAAVKKFIATKVDLILSCGGDGTARDICSIARETIAQVPAGEHRLSSHPVGENSGVEPKLVAACKRAFS
jgi:hypothetical protein